MASKVGQDRMASNGETHFCGASGQHRAIVLSAIAVRFGEMVCAQNGLRSAKCTANDMVTTMSIAVRYIAGFLTVVLRFAQLVPFALFGRLLKECAR